VLPRCRGDTNFEPRPKDFTIGYYDFAKRTESYERLVLFRYEDGRLRLQPTIGVGGTAITLPLTSQIEQRVGSRKGAAADRQEQG
jgi:hypothetical protein